MNIWKGIKRVGNYIADSFVSLCEPTAIKVQRAQAQFYMDQARNAYKHVLDEHIKIKTPMIASDHTFTLLKFNGTKAEPYSVHHLTYKQRPMAVDTAIAWILSQYEAQGYTVDDIESMRSKVAVQEMLGHQGFLSDYVLVLSDDGSYWVQITPAIII